MLRYLVDFFLLFFRHVSKHGEDYKASHEACSTVDSGCYEGVSATLRDIFIANCIRIYVYAYLCRVSYIMYSRSLTIAYAYK